VGNSLEVERADAVVGCVSRWVDDVGEPGMKKANGQAAGAGESKEVLRFVGAGKRQGDKTL